MTVDTLRDNKGRFVPGHKTISPGRSPRVTEDSKIDLFKAHYSDADITQILDALKRRCIKGDATAIKIFMEYWLGKPVQQVDMNSDSNIRIMVVHELVAGAVVPLLDDAEEGEYESE